jgi:hypothetical protein
VRAVDERVVELVAGGEHDDVVFGARAVGEAHGSTVEPVDVGHHPQVALTEVVQDECVHDRMRLVDLVVGLREAESHGIARERPQHSRVDELL